MAQNSMSDFFAMEAGEYLERLDLIVSPAQPPDPDEFLRLARALRGSALMANREEIAAAAAGLEAAARSVRESRIAWDAATKQVVIRAVDDLKILVRSLANWSPREDEKARAVATDLERLTGVRATARPSGRGPDAGTRAFVAREGAVVAAELERLAEALGQGPANASRTDGLVKALQPLRGVAGLADLPPLPDILDGIERALGSLRQDPGSASRAGAVFGAAAQALTRAAREASAGAPAADSPELAAFASRLRDLLAPDGDTVPISALFYDDAGPHIVQAGAPPARAGAIDRVQLVSHGDHLKQAADGLERAASAAQRELRAQTVAPTLRALSDAGGAIAAFAAAARDVLGRIGSISDISVVTTGLRDAGKLLSHASGTDDTGLAESLSRIAGMLRVGTPTAAAPRPAAPAPARPAAAPASAGGETDESPDLTGSFLKLARYQAALGMGAASVDELLAGPPVLAGAASLGAAVGIADLAYSGDAALQRALALREEARAALKSGGGGRLNDLLEEVFDLVQLGLQRGS